MFQQVHQTHGISLFPGIGESDFRRNSVQRCVQCQLATFHQGHDTDGREALGNGCGPERCLGGGWNLPGDVGEPIAFFENDVAVFNQYNRSTGHLAGLEQFGQLAVQTVDIGRQRRFPDGGTSAGAQ